MRVRNHSRANVSAASASRSGRIAGAAAPTTALTDRVIPGAVPAIRHATSRHPVSDSNSAARGTTTSTRPSCKAAGAWVERSGRDREDRPAPADHLGEPFRTAPRRHDAERHLVEADPEHHRPRCGCRPRSRPRARLKLDDATPPSLQAAIDDFMLYGSPVQIPAENIGGLNIDMPGGLGSQFAGGGIALEGKIAAADAAEANYLVLRVPPAPPSGMS